MKEKDIHFTERRQYQRFNVRYFTTIYVGNETLYASVTNISEDGVGVTLTKKLPIDEVIVLEIGYKIGGEEKAEIHIKVKVIWCEGLGGDRIFRAGLKIIEVSKEHIGKFRKCIQELMEHGEKIG